MKRILITFLALALIFIVSFELYQAINQDDFKDIFTIKFLGLACSCIFFVSEAFQIFNKELIQSNEE